MKNIQVIDGADNCTYDIYAVTEDEFKIIFPGEGQDIEFIEDFWERIERNPVPDDMMSKIWDRYVYKKDVVGIHGTLFYGLRDIKKEFYPDKTDEGMVTKYGTPHWRK